MYHTNVGVKFFIHVSIVAPWWRHFRKIKKYSWAVELQDKLFCAIFFRFNPLGCTIRRSWRKKFIFGIWASFVSNMNNLKENLGCDPFLTPFCKRSVILKLIDIVKASISPFCAVNRAPKSLYSRGPDWWKISCPRSHLQCKGLDPPLRGKAKF